MSDKNKDCPICNEDYHNLAMSDSVCDMHLDWMVIICRSCKRASFSYNSNICPDCLNSDLDIRFFENHANSKPPESTNS